MTPDDPRLSAYALGELSERDLRLVEAEVAKEPELSREVGDLSSLAALLGETLGGERFSLGAERHDEIFKAGKRPDTKVIVMENQKKSRRQSFLSIVGVAAAVTFGFYLLSQVSVSEPAAPLALDAGGKPADLERSGVARGASAAVGAEEAGIPEEGEFPSGYVPRQPLSVEKVTVTELTPLRVPLRVKRADLSAYERALATGRSGTARMEEWINVGDYSFDAELELGGVGVAAELGACSWDSRKSLLLVTFRDLRKDGVAAQVTADLLLEHGRVMTAQLVASGSVSGSVPKVQTMEADASVALLYELELLPGESRIAAIDLEVLTGRNDSKNGYLPVVEEAEMVSVNFRRASTLAHFVKWKNRPEQDSSELREIAERARALLGQVTDGRTRYALDLILLTADAKK